jgi:hypothetical protein
MVWYEQISGTWLLIGGIIMFLSSAITSYANIMMKLDSNQLRDEAHPGFILGRRFVLIAVTLYVVGGLADVVSLGLVPLSLRACASCLTIPFNAIFARFTLNEHLSFLQMIGSAVTVFSCVVAMLFAAKQDEDTRGVSIINGLWSTNMWKFLAYTVPLYLGCLVLVWRHVPEPGSHVGLPTYKSAIHRLIVLGSATIATSYQTAWSNFFIKCIAVMAQESLVDATLWILVGLLSVSAIGQMMLMSSMMRLFEAVVVIPPYQIAVTVWLIVFSYVAFNEQVHNVIGFVLALSFSFFGIILVAIPQRASRTLREPLVVIQRIE